MAEQKEEMFQVVDRRHFTSEGELRKEVIEEEKKAAQAEKAVRAEKSPASSEAESASALEKPTETAEAIPPSRPFQMLVSFLAQNAAAMLGGIPDPRTGQAYLDLEGTRELIDMLDVLREKSRGNLAKEDDLQLMEVIGSLKLSFMEVSKAASKAMQDKAKRKP
ncbi:MAG: DUF1844 domain-containing protein [Candidatus Acidiferrales bacterium]